MTLMAGLSHVDDGGRARMVDVGSKPVQRRLAIATGRITMAPATRELIAANQIAKGDVLTVAQIAGIQAAKQVPELIPLCHTLVLDHVEVGFELGDDGLTATAQAACCGRTGAEMEALAAVSVALLTIYDMCKAVDKEMRIGDITLVEKSKSDIANR
jgi:cyclic pyranopterin phosphate synthase